MIAYTTTTAGINNKNMSSAPSRAPLYFVGTLGVLGVNLGISLISLYFTSLYMVLLSKKGTTTTGRNTPIITIGKAHMPALAKATNPSIKVENDCCDWNIVAMAIFCSSFVAPAF